MARLLASVLYLSPVLAQVATTGTVQVASSCTPEVRDWQGGYPDPKGDFGTALHALHTDIPAGLPADECAFIAKLPASQVQDYLKYASRVHTWWEDNKSRFSEWSSTCTGTLGTGQDVRAWVAFREAVTPFLEPTAQARLNSYTPTAVTCPTTTIVPATTTTQGMAPQKTPIVGAAVVAAAVACVAVGV